MQFSFNVHSLPADLIENNIIYALRDCINNGRKAFRDWWALHCGLATAYVRTQPRIAKLFRLSITITFFSPETCKVKKATQVARQCGSRATSGMLEKDNPISWFSVLSLRLHESNKVYSVSVCFAHIQSHKIEETFASHPHLTRCFRSTVQPCTALYSVHSTHCVLRRSVHARYHSTHYYDYYSYIYFTFWSSGFSCAEWTVFSGGFLLYLLLINVDYLYESIYSKRENSGHNNIIMGGLIRTQLMVGAYMLTCRPLEHECLNSGRDRGREREH